MSGQSDSPDDERSEATESDRTADQSAGSQENSITSGSIARPLFHLAWPIVVIQLLQVTYNVIDTLFLGRFSTDAVGALSLSFPLIFLIISIAAGFTTAGAILVAQYTGAKGAQSAGLVAGQAISFVGGLSVVLGIVGYLYTRPALRLLPSDPDTAAAVVPLAADYMEVFFLGMPFLFGFFVFSALMRGYGDTRTPMLVMVVSVAINVVLDPIFIFGFESNPLFGWIGATELETTLYALTEYTGWGIEGAALATVIARGFGGVIGFYVLFLTTRGPAVALADLIPDLSVIRNLITLGVPTMLEQSTSALAQIALTAIVVTFNPAVVSAYGLGNRIASLIFLPAMGLGRAIDTMVGQNLGANRPDRAGRAVLFAAVTGAGILLIAAVIIATVTEPFVSVFIGDVPNAAATIELGIEYVRIRSAEFAFLGVSQVILGAFRGAGNTKTAMVISIITLWVGRVGTVLLLVFQFDWGATGIWVGMAVGNILGAIVGVGWFLRGTWKTAYIDTDESAQAPQPAQD